MCHRPPAHAPSLARSSPALPLGAPDTVRSMCGANDKDQDAAISPPPWSCALSLGSQAPTTHSLQMSSLRCSLLQRWIVGCGVRVATSGVRIRCHRRAGLLQVAEGVTTRVAGLATRASQCYYKDWPNLLGRASYIATMVWQRCNQRPSVFTTKVH
jgi:hypothetical protein